MNVRQSLLLAVMVICTGLFSSCSQKHAEDDGYTQEILQWRADRVNRLRGPQSWLSLIGRFPIKPGTQSVGSIDTHDIELPVNEAIDLMSLTLDTSFLSLQAAEKTEIRTDNDSLFVNGIINMKTPPMLHHGSLYFTFLEREGKYFLRIWDTLSPARNAVKEIPAYPPDKKWIVEATFSPADPNASIILDDVQGEKRSNRLMGTVSGTWNNKDFSLLALEGGESELFLIIEDSTTDVETYPGGRYLYIPMPDSTGKTVIDFNKAYIPPCAFTEFATCLLPPQENRLPFAVTAGEKTFHLSGHE